MGKGERRPRTDQSVRIVPGDTVEIETARVIFRLFVENRLGFRSIADHLNRIGNAYRGGRQWTEQQVRSVLTHELFGGVLAYNRTTWRLNAEVSRQTQDEWSRIILFDPVIDAALHKAALERLKS